MFLIALIKVVFPAPGGPLIEKEMVEANPFYVVHGSKLLSSTSGSIFQVSVSNVYLFFQIYFYLNHILI